MKYKEILSPVGRLKIVTEDKWLVAILWDKEKLNRVRLGPMVEDTNDPTLLEVEKQLKEYFLQQRKSFNVPMVARGTSFQKAVWKLLSEIPYGVTWSYKEIAYKMLRPNAVRAVGAAIGRNPISIVIPCHRVLASNGGLTGFAGGLDRKKTLLNLESRLF